MDTLQQGIRSLRLELTTEELTQIRAALLARLREGLASPGQQIAMLPAYVAPPDSGLSGDAVAVDAGGTNLRAALVRVADGAAQIVGEVAELPLPGAAGRPAATAEQFFAAHHEVIRLLPGADGLPVGYCFSYPSTSREDGDATLNKWTKEVRVSGVEGRAVGQLLREHLAVRGLHLGRVVVLNDTIAALMAGALGPEISPLRAAGLIVGTGSNIGAFLPVGRLGKLPELSWPPGAMAVNFECGNFDVPLRGPVDEAVDAASEDPGDQRLEKMVSGAYLGRIFAEAGRRLELELPEAAEETATVSELARETRSQAGDLARAVIVRSADLVAAALAATSALLGGVGRLSVFAEGSVFWKAPRYSQRVASTYAALARSRLQVGSAQNANLVGSALAALSRSAEEG